MFAQHTENPEEWTVAKLAATYGVSQPRVQAILLLKTWEKQDEENGVNSELGNQLEDLVSLLTYLLCVLICFQNIYLYCFFFFFLDAQCSYENCGNVRKRV